MADDVTSNIMRDDSHIPTLREIARRARVSAMTVSRALKNHPKQNPETNRRIRDLAIDMGWKPNPLVSALMGQRVRQHGTRSSANLAILDPRSDDTPANADYIRGARQQAADFGYALDVFPYRPEDVSPAKLRSILDARGIRGLILMPLPVGVDQVDFDFRVPIQSFEDFLHSREKEEIIIVEDESEDPNFWIGTVAAVNAEDVELLPFTGAARILDPASRIPFDRISCCQMNTNYIRFYQRYFDRLRNAE